MLENFLTFCCFLLFFYCDHFSFICLILESLHPNNVSSVRQLPLSLSPQCLCLPVASHLHHLRPSNMPEAAISLLLLTVWMDQLNGSTRTSRETERWRGVPGSNGTSRTQQQDGIAQKGIFTNTQLSGPFHYQLMRYLSKWSCVSLYREPVASSYSELWHDDKRNKKTKYYSL